PTKGIHWAANAGLHVCRPGHDPACLTGDVYPAPDLAAGPTSTAPLPALPVDFRCPLGGLSVVYTRGRGSTRDRKEREERHDTNGSADGRGACVGGGSRRPRYAGRQRGKKAARHD